MIKDFFAFYHNRQLFYVNSDMITVMKTETLETDGETGTGLKTRASGSQGEHPQLKMSTASTSIFFQICVVVRSAKKGTCFGICFHLCSHMFYMRFNLDY